MAVALHSIFSNISWLFLDKIFRMGAGLIVGAWIARYLGPENFGIWNVAIAYTALFGSFINFGLESILVKEIVRNPQERNGLMGSSFAICAVGAGLAFALSLLGAHFFVATSSSLKFKLILLSSAGLLTQATFVLNYYFQAKVQSWVIVAVQSVAFVFATGAKVILLLNGGGVIAFAWMSLAELIMSAVLMTIVFHKRIGSVFRWQVNFVTIRRLLSDGIPLMFANIASMIYMRVDQIMIGGMLGDFQVGLFSAAIKISETWYFLPSIVGTSVFPALIGSFDAGQKEFERKNMLFFEILTGVGLVIAVVISLASSFIIGLLFGSDYSGSAAILSVHVWGGIFICMGIASSYWLTIHGLQRYNLYRSLAGLAVNIFLNLLLIPRMGALGAALASATAQMSALFLFDILNAQTRPLFKVKINAFCFRESRRLAVEMLRRYA